MLPSVVLHCRPELNATESALTLGMYNIVWKTKAACSATATEAKCPPALPAPPRAPEPPAPKDTDWLFEAKRGIFTHYLDKLQGSGGSNSNGNKSTDFSAMVDVSISTSTFASTHSFAAFSFRFQNTPPSPSMFCGTPISNVGQSKAKEKRRLLIAPHDMPLVFQQ